VPENKELWERKIKAKKRNGTGVKRVSIHAVTTLKQFNSLAR
jgi:hypothetical protein